VRHPNVAIIHGADVHDGRAGFWTDRIRGHTLEEGLAERGPLGAGEATVIGLELCRALAAVHTAGLVHGDVKAGNVMREGGGEPGARPGRIVLLDFGAARDVAGGAGIAAAAGTPLSAAPEILAGGAPTPAADLYSLGALLHRLLTGRHPIEAATLEELLARHRERPVAPLRAARPDLSTAMVQVVLRALAADPSDRFRDAGEMEAALAEAAGAARARAPGPWRAALRAAPWVAAAAAVALGVALLWPRARTGDPTGTAETRTGPPALDAAARAPAPAAPASPDAGAADVATAGGPLRADAVMVRTNGGGHEPLADGASVRPGDQLALELEVREPVHVYVLNEDEAGALFVMFPTAGLDGGGNPLGAGRHRLPGRRAGAALDWQVTSAGGRERFLIVAARRPVAEIERRIASLEPARPGQPVRYPALDSAVIDEFRGVGGMVENRRPAPASDGRLTQIADAIRRGAREPGGVWVRLVEMAGAAP
jgi:hypothetical protein